MSKIGVVAKIVAQPGKRGDLASALQAALDTAEGEAGTLAYILHSDDAADDVLWMYELYESKEALQEHMGSPAFAALGPVIGPYLAGRPELTFLTPIGGKGL